MSTQPQTFWEHLDELRGSLIKMIAAVLVCGVVAFFFKEELFDIILAPQRPEFVTYRLLESLSAWFVSLTQSDALSSLPLMGDLEGVTLINTGLAHQFLIHVRTAFCAGIVLTSPYLLYLLFHFISPALYRSERRYALRLVCSGYVMFMLGVLLSYFLIFPLTYRFLGTYQVSEVVANTVTLESYIDTLMMISLSMGVVFEIPVICWLLARFGIIRASVMRRYSRHVFVAILIIAAIITPTSDIFTLAIVSLPMWLLYELSILIVRRTRGER